MYSFSDWCLENEKQEYLDRWDYEKNDLSPKEITYRSHRFIFLKCPRNIHESEQYLVSTITTPIKSNGICRACNSLAQFCIDNELYYHKYWDYVKNKKSPFEVGAFSNKKYWFLCPDGIHDSELYTVSEVVRSDALKCKKCASLAHKIVNLGGVELLSKVWSKKNSISPYDINYLSENSIFLNCENGLHGSYKTSPYQYSRGGKCPYCSGRKVQDNNSFAAYNINLIGSDFLDKYWASKNTINPWRITPKSTKFIYIQCQNNENHIYSIRAHSFSNGIRCPFCCGHKVLPEESLATDSPEVISIWSEKNELSPYEVSRGSNKKYWFKCADGKHKDYSKTISNARHGHWLCPECVRHTKKSFLHKSVESYLTETCNLEILTESKCSLYPRNPETKYPLPYDIEVVKYKLIIEVNGQQHYDTNAYRTLWNKPGVSPEEQFEYRKRIDEYKKQYALDNGYYYLEIPYWSAKEFEELIDSKIQEIS